MVALPLALVIFTLGQTTAQVSSSAPGFDTDVTVPANARPTLEARAEGVQIYTCSPQGVSFAWVFKAPEAKLSDSAGQPVATHAAGPVWTASDGSAIRGKVIAQKVAADPLSVSWLLLVATPEAGKPGTLSNVTFVRRSDTRGGVAPVDGCDASHAGTDVRVPYSATYTFYRSEVR